MLKSNTIIGFVIHQTSLVALILPFEIIQRRKGIKAP